ncbi:CDP-alcohol phosphatidyltransferase [Microbacterium sp. BWT-B31]|uniref:CDP-alcohol phosphatidyltransferase n=1 Tax=Microbacterium sp. BWT-B31 TaxID=3232072 RepID=UPI003527174E
MASRRARVATVAALAVLLAVPLVAGALSAGTPAALLSLPVESIVVVLLLVAVASPRWRAVVAGVFGAVVVAAVLAAALDAGFRATIDRGFSPAEDAPAVVSAVGVVADAAGPVNAGLLVALVAGVLAAAAVVLARCALRVGRVAARSEGAGRIAITAVAAAWIVGALAGTQLVPGVPLAAAESARALAATAARTAQSVRDQADFQRALASDPLRDAPDGGLFGALAGKDVVIVFVESYGEVAVRDSAFTQGVAQTLREGGEQLTRDGYSAQSALLTSPTFGGVSWLAHATLHSGVWADSPQKYDSLTSSDRLTLARLFADAGWRTVSVVPSNTGTWPVGRSFYGYDAMLDAGNLGYTGPAFSYARVPDQFTLQAFHDRELTGSHAPVMAEIDLVSSHTPWTPLPRLVPWSEVADASVFDAQPAQDPAPIELWADPHRVQEMYGESVEYSLGALFTYLHAYDQPNLVLVMLGDHQPARIVSGADADHDVPVTIIAKDPAVFARIASWRWEPGVRPSADAPVWRMDAFRDRFVDAFTP